MKIKTQLIMAGIFTMASATAIAASSTYHEILAGVDGEYSYHMSEGSQRTNFDMSAMGSDLLDQVLSGVDGEYGEISSDGMRTNYSMPAGDSDIIRDQVLSGVDGEYFD